MTFLVGFMLIMSPLLLMSSNSWIIYWLMLELSSMSFIIFISSSIKNDWSLMYFLIQGFGSIFFLSSFLLKEVLFLMDVTFEMFMMILIFSMMMKLGMFPFHYWMMKLGVMLNLKQMVILLVVQKLAPIWLAMIFFFSKLLLISLGGLALGTLMQFSVMNIIILMIFSSIIHLSWMLIMSFKYMLFLMFYYFIYSLILAQMLMFLYKNNFMKINSMKFFNFFFIMALYSMAGMPLLLGFFPKWMIFYLMAKESLYLLIILFIFFTSMNFYIYNRLTYENFLIKNMLILGNKMFYSIKMIVTNLFFPMNMVMI